MERGLERKKGGAAVADPQRRAIEVKATKGLRREGVLRGEGVFWDVAFMVLPVCNTVPHTLGRNEKKTRKVPCWVGASSCAALFLGGMSARRVTP